MLARDFFGISGKHKNLDNMENDIKMYLRMKSTKPKNLKKTIETMLFGATLLSLCAVVGMASPSTVNIIPTADVLSPNVLRVSFEADGHTTPYDNTNTSYTYTEFGLGGKTEIGVDFYDINGSNKARWNGKYLLFGGNDHCPAIAVGAMAIGDESKTQLFAVGTKSINKLRVHFGAQTNGNQEAMMMGMDYVFAKNVTLMADWQSGVGFFHTVGLWWQATPIIGVNPYYARNNTEELRGESDYWGLYLSYDYKL